MFSSTAQNEKKKVLYKSEYQVSSLWNIAYWSNQKRPFKMNIVQVYVIFRISQMLGTFEVKVLWYLNSNGRKVKVRRDKFHFLKWNQAELLETESLGMKETLNRKLCCPCQSKIYVNKDIWEFMAERRGKRWKRLLILSSLNLDF